jgi:competence protein ComGC
MKTLQTVKTMFIVTLMFLFVVPALAQKKEKGKEKSAASAVMKTYVIEREIPEAGKLTADELKGISQTSCNVLNEMGPSIEWLHSYVTENKIYCVYRTTDKELLKKHAEKGGFPINSISELSAQISPATAKQ